MTSCDVSQYTQLQVIDFFVELSDIAHCNEGIAKEMKILKITGDFRQRQSFVFATILLIIIFYILANHFASYLSCDSADILEGKFACFEDVKIVLARFLTSLNL